MELLAPAGNFAAFEAALAEGADAVYIGAPGFNARSLRRDFSLADIGALIRQAHDAGKRLYVAMNSLVKEAEIAAAVEILASLETLSPDALIIQDIGLLRLAKENFPALSLHASTLMSVHNALGAQYLTELGMERVVLARELSLEDIRQIGQQTTAQLEVFIHGAMCFSYSGLCLFSSMHGGKSSLRGQCVQPCRRHYRLATPRKGRMNTSERNRQGKFLFSMNDLCGIRFLDQLRRIGVVSLKIEGRLKSAEYVRQTVRAYRLCLDNRGASNDQRKRVQQEAEALLDAAMSRKRSSGFFQGNTKDIVSPDLSGGAGIFAGKAKLHSGKRALAASQPLCSVSLRADIRLGDRLRFQNERNDVRESFTLQLLQRNRRSVQHAQKGQNVQIGLPRNVVEGRSRVKEGLLFLVDRSQRRKNEGRVETAISRKNTGSTPRPDRKRIDQVLGTLGWKQQGDDMLPAVNSSATGGREKGSRRPQWWLRCNELPPVKQRYPFQPTYLLVQISGTSWEQVQLLGKKAHALYPQVVWMLPPVIHQQDVAWYREVVEALLKRGFIRYQLGHLSQLRLFAEYTSPAKNLQLFGDYTLNILNSAACRFVRQQGLNGTLFSVETDRATLAHALAAGREIARHGQSGNFPEIGMYVYGRLPLFTARLQAAHLQMRKSVVSPKGEYYGVERKNNLTYVRPRAPLVLFNYVQEMMAMGVAYFVVDLQGGAFQREVASAAAWMQGKKEGQEKLTGNYTQGLA